MELSYYELYMWGKREVWDAYNDIGEHFIKGFFITIIFFFFFSS